MRDKDTISKGPKRRDETCYQVLHDIVIPAGTILRHRGGNNFGCEVTHGDFLLVRDSADAHPNKFNRVIAT